MDGKTIPPIPPGDFFDKEYREEIYESWNFVKTSFKMNDIELFCKCFGITIDQLVEVISEFDEE
jgi:hypothetical protein